eukprot:TRINITY_DN48456_c0_g1_i1.p1 TRINITY_DN48456_c0_g1~~TRINITY_DN48456_c0_g1_i1.p1  ORF type:complete len:994 (+),score=139.24 TRINITY_DN48456_c0_g1_i1:170-2983(+)
MVTIGGRTGVHTWTNQIFFLDLDTNLWAELHHKGQESFIGRNVHTATLHNGKVYIIGGRTGYFSWVDEAWVLDPSTRQLNKLAPSGEALQQRGRHSASLHGSKIYIYGGENRNVMYDDLLVYDIESNSFSKVTPASSVSPGVRVGHSTVVYKNHLYLFGGHDSHNAYHSEVYQFSFESQTWSTVGAQSMTEIRAGHSTTLIGNNVWIFGGHDSQNKLNSVAVFNLETREWQDTAITGSIPSPRQGHCAALNEKNSGIYLFGGAEGYFSMYNDVYVLHTDPKYFVSVQKLPAPPRHSRSTSSSSDSSKMLVTLPLYEKTRVAGLLLSLSQLSDRLNFHKGSKDLPTPAEEQLQGIIQETIPDSAMYHQAVRVCRGMEPKLVTLNDTRDAWISQSKTANLHLSEIEILRRSKAEKIKEIVALQDQATEAAATVQAQQEAMESEEETQMHHAKKKSEYYENKKTTDNVINDLNRRLADQKRNVRTDQTKLEHLNSQIRAAQHAMDTAQGSIDQFTTKLNEYTTKVSTLTTELDTITAEIVEMEKKSAGGDRAALIQQRNELISAQQEQERVKSQQSTILDQYNKFEETKHRWFGRAARALRDDTTNEPVAENCHEVVQEDVWEALARKFRDAIEDLTRRINEAERQEGDYFIKISAKRERRDLIDAQLREVRADAADAGRRLDDAKRDYQKEKNKIENELNQQVKHIQNDVDLAATVQASIQTEIETTQREQEAATAAWADVERAHEEWASQRLAKQKQLEKLLRELEGYLDQIGRKIDELDTDRRSIDDLNRRVSNVASEAASSHNLYKTVATTLQQLMKQLLQGCADEAKVARDEAAATAVKLEKATKENKALADENAALKAKIEKLQAEMKESAISKLGGAVKKAAGAVVDAVEDAVEAVEDAVKGDDDDDKAEQQDDDDDEDEQFERREYKPATEL